jgi:hypothetical protein
LKGVCKNRERIVLNNKFLHVRCCARIVNLVVKSGLEAHNVSIDKLRTTIRLVRSSPSRLKLFKKCAKLEKIASKSLLTLDVETRWNSSYLMLESAEKFEKASSVTKRLGAFHLSPTKTPHLNLSRFPAALLPASHPYHSTPILMGT